MRWGGDWDLVIRCSMWGVGWGIVGARLYHVITSWDEVPDEWWGVFAVWKGGLGIWGGIAAGVLAGAIVARRAGANVPLLADAFAPGILLAQVIGRFGNYFNQELFGKPSDLPWGVEIDPENRPGRATSRPRRSIRSSSTRALEPDRGGRPHRRRSSPEAGRDLLPLRDVVLARARSPGRSTCGSTRRTTSPACG